MRYILLLFCFVYSIEFTSAQRVAPIKITALNATTYRDSLVGLIFGTATFPYNLMPDSVITNVHSIDHYNDFPYNPLLYPSGNLDSIDKMVITVGANSADFPSKAKVYLFHPHNSNGKLFIYHSGHCVGVAPAEDIASNNNGVEPGMVIPRLIAEGYTVLSVPMLYYQASPPNGVWCGLNNHDDLFLNGHYTNPLSFFFNPLIASLNRLGRSNYSAIYMCGLSGGGWTTSIYPAIDSSVICSFPVAGSWPIPVRQAYSLGGDYEQTYPPLFSRFLDYHEIYTLACLAPERSMLQINNRYDACCFSGSTAHLYYVDSVARALTGTNGIFKFYLDETGNEHRITERAVDIMLTFLSGQSAHLTIAPPDTVTDGTNYYYNIKNNFTVNGPANNFPLRYSLLKSPAWMNLDPVNGILSGNASVGTIVTAVDTISFKVEDSIGRFVVYNYLLTRKRSGPFFFTKFDDNKTIYCVPPFSHALQAISPSASLLFYFNNPTINITGLSIENNSLIKINTNIPVTAFDQIGYQGFDNLNGVTYFNGIKMENFGLTRIRLDAVSKNIAVAGMMRFNINSGKFEYFNGKVWVNMN